MFHRALIIWASALFLTVTSALTVDQSQAFPKGSEVENLALRASGNALVVVNTRSQIFEVEPVANATPKVVHTFDNALGASSITASGTQKDVFYVVTGNVTFSTSGVAPEPNSYSIHRLSFDHQNQAVMREIAPLDAVKQPNGIISVPNTPYVLIADCNAGLVFRFNTETRELTTYWDNALLKPTPPVPGQPEILFGVNGLKLSNGYLYFSNTNQQFVGRIKATGTEPCLEGKPEKVVTQVSVDDFLLNDGNGDIYMALQTPNPAQQGFGVWRPGSNSSAFELLYQTLGPTAAAWAKGAVGRTLVGTAAGDFTQFATHNYTGGGKVVSIHLKK